MTTFQQIGVRRLIERPGRKPYVQTEELVCPCCGHLTRVEFDQPSFAPNLPALTLTHCTHQGCAAYFMTHTRDQFIELFGSDSDNSVSQIER